MQRRHLPRQCNFYFYFYETRFKNLFFQACFSANTNFYCYSITDVTNRTLCIAAESTLVATTISLPAQQPDVYLMSQVPPCTPATTQYRTPDGSCNNDGSVPFAAGAPSWYNARYSGMANSLFTHEYISTSLAAIE